MFRVRYENLKHFAKKNQGKSFNLSIFTFAKQAWCEHNGNEFVSRWQSFAFKQNQSWYKISNKPTHSKNTPMPILSNRRGCVELSYTAWFCIMRRMSSVTWVACTNSLHALIIKYCVEWCIHRLWASLYSKSSWACALHEFQYHFHPNPVYPYIEHIWDNR